MLYQMCHFSSKRLEEKWHNWYSTALFHYIPILYLYSSSLPLPHASLPPPQVSLLAPVIALLVAPSHCIVNPPHPQVALLGLVTPSTSSQLSSLELCTPSPCIYPPPPGICTGSRHTSACGAVTLPLYIVTPLHSPKYLHSGFSPPLHRYPPGIFTRVNLYAPKYLYSDYSVPPSVLLPSPLSTPLVSLTPLPPPGIVTGSRDCCLGGALWCPDGRRRRVGTWILIPCARLSLWAQRHRIRGAETQTNSIRDCNHNNDTGGRGGRTSTSDRASATSLTCLLSTTDSTSSG